MLIHPRAVAPSRSLTSCTLLCVFASLSVLGCGGGAPSSRDPSRHTALDPISLLPPDTQAVLDVDVATVRNAPFMARVDEVLEPVMDSQAASVRDLINRIDRVALAFLHEAASDGSEDLLIVARGRFSAADLETFAASQTPGTHREHALRRDGPTVLALAYDHTLLFGSDRWVLAALDRLDGLSPPAGPESAVMVDATRRAQLGQHTVTFASEVSHSFRSDNLSEFPMRANAVSFGGWLDVADPLRLQGFALFDDEAAAAALAAALRDKIAEGQQSPELAAAGFEGLFASAEIVANSTVVDVTYSVDNATFERVILAAANGFMAFQSAAATAIEEEPAPAEADPNAQP